jgi:hypothetical protein
MLRQLQPSAAARAAAPAGVTVEIAAATLLLAVVP